MVVKVTQPDGLACYSDMAAGVKYVAQNGADVINISLRGQLNSAALQSAVVATSETAVVVSSAGNDAGDAPVYPAAYDPVLAVTGTDTNDIKHAVANYGAWVDVSAPGQDLVTTDSGGGTGPYRGPLLPPPLFRGWPGCCGANTPSGRRPRYAPGSRPRRMTLTARIKVSGASWAAGGSTRPEPSPKEHRRLLAARSKRQAGSQSGGYRAQVGMPGPAVIVDTD
jgi:hypothetical protein